MALANDTFWDGPSRDAFRLPSIGLNKIVSGAAILAVGVLIAGWSLTAIGTIHNVQNSISADPGLIPEGALGSGAVALLHSARPSTAQSQWWEQPLETKTHHEKYASLNVQREPIKSVPREKQISQTTVQQDKAMRLTAQAGELEATPSSGSFPVKERFGEANSDTTPLANRRGLTFVRSRLAAAATVKSSRLAFANAEALSDERAAAFTQSKPTAAPSKSVALASAQPDDARFARTVAEAVSALERNAPAAERFGSAAKENEEPSRLALAVVKSALTGETGIPLPSAPPLRAAAPASEDSSDIIASQTNDPFADSVPQSVPLPTRRPDWDAVMPPAKPAPVAPPARIAVAPAPRTAVPQSTRTTRGMLAYAAPDDSDEGGPMTGLGGLFHHKSSVPTPPSGVAVYDIKAATVYMPNGERLEAHSGLGHMVDKPRYADEKGRGPTPPNTYNLVLRERRFHGVEAIRLLPVDGKKKYGRDGLLAHTYMLRGGLAQSNGCVVFKDYQRFLKAFKRGRITRMVVVPDMSHASTRIASAARGA